MTRAEFLDGTENALTILVEAVRLERQRPTRDALSVMDAIGDLHSLRVRWLDTLLDETPTLKPRSIE